MWKFHSRMWQRSRGLWLNSDFQPQCTNKEESLTSFFITWQNSVKFIFFTLTCRLRLQSQFILLNNVGGSSWFTLVFLLFQWYENRIWPPYLEVGRAKTAISVSVHSAVFSVKWKWVQTLTSREVNAFSLGSGVCVWVCAVVVLFCYLWNLSFWKHHEIVS